MTEEDWERSKAADKEHAERFEQEKAQLRAEIEEDRERRMSEWRKRRSY
jgi:hypothetical protein